MMFRGAEAIVESIKWNGLDAISKIRNPRSYRHPALEKRLVRERMRSEVRIIVKLISNGLAVPSLYSVDVANSQIIMEFLEGMTLEQALRNKDFEKNLVGPAELLASIHGYSIQD